MFRKSFPMMSLLRKRPLVILAVLIAFTAVLASSGCTTPPPRLVAQPPALVGLPMVDAYQLTIAGQVIPIYEAPAGHFALIHADGPVEATLTRRGAPVQQAVLRPLPQHQTPTLTGGEVRFHIAGPTAAALELDGDQAKPLFLFVKAAEAPSQATPATYTFAPGQVHELPGGKLLLKSGESVYIPAGAVVRGSILAQGTATEPVRNVRVYGQGVLMATEKQPLAFIRAEGVQVEGLTILNTLEWTVRIFDSSHVEVRGVHVFSTGNFSDGMDIMGSRDVMVRESFFHSHDDCIAIKGRKWTFGGPVERVTLQDLVIWKAVSGNGIEIGYETDVESIRDITVRRIAIMHVGRKDAPFRRAALSMHHCGRAAISNVLYEDITIEQASENLIYLWVGASKFAKDAPLGSIHDVTYRRVRYLDGRPVPSVIESTEAPGRITGVRFEGCEMLRRPVTSAADLGLQVKDAPLPMFQP